MKLINVFKRFISLFTNKPIEKGMSFSNDDNITLPRDTGFEILESTTLHRGTFFNQKKVEGAFELVGFVRSGEKNLYQIKHVYSGETFNLTRNMLNFLFERSES